MPERDVPAIRLPGVPEARMRSMWCCAETKTVAYDTRLHLRPCAHCDSPAHPMCSCPDRPAAPASRQEPRS